MRAKSVFTLVELITVVVIIGILATLGYPLYVGTVEDINAKVCENNLLMLQQAVEIYGLRNDVMPTSLSKLDRQDIKLAWQRIFKHKPAWKIKLAYFLVDLNKYKGNIIYAASSFREQFIGNNLQYITCPADKSPPKISGGKIVGVSYCLNKKLAGMSYADYKKLGGKIVAVADCDKASGYFSNANDFALRHKHPKVLGAAKDYAQAITKSRDIFERNNKGQWKFKKGSHKGMKPEISWP